MRVAILRNERADSGENWLLACQKRGIAADVIDLTSINALDEIMAKEYDMFLLRPPGISEKYKSIYDERVYHIERLLGRPVFPSFFECFIYENKRCLAQFLQLKSIAHPKTWVVCDYPEALDLVRNVKLPVVAKTSIGAASSGVKIFKQRDSLHKYIKVAFKGRGIRKRFGPNKQVGNPQSWLKKAISDPEFLKRRLIQYLRAYSETQKGYVILQEYIQHDFEWRVVKIGESFFAYKKYKVGDKASGAKNLGYDNPPLELLDWVRWIAEENGIKTAAFDIFENHGNFLINEIQTIFGHKMDHILEVDGKPGRYRYQNGDWVFEEGMFNSNESYDLRLEVALKLYNEVKL